MDECTVQSKKVGDISKNPNVKNNLRNTVVFFAKHYLAIHRDLLDVKVLQP